MSVMQECIEQCSACMQACTMCADQMAGMADMGMCAGMCMNTADMCDTTLRAMLRPMGMTPMLLRTIRQTQRTPVQKSRRHHRYDTGQLEDIGCLILKVSFYDDRV